MKKYAPLVVAIVVGIGTLLKTIVSIDDALNQIASTRSFAYLYSVWDLLGIEIVLGILVLLAVNPIAGVFVHTARTTAKWFSTQPLEKTLGRLIVAIVIGAGAMMLAGYQGYYLILGKYSMWATHDRSLLRRAADSFLRGEHDRAQLLVSVCNTLYETCGYTQLEMDRRLERAAAVREIEAQLPSGSPARPAYALAAYAHDRRWDLYQNSIRSLRRDFNRAKAIWVTALGQLHRGDSAQALVTLAQLQDIWPGFADSHYWLEQLREGRSAAIVETLRRRGVDPVAAETAAPFEVRSLDRLALSPIQKLQALGPDRASWDEYGYERADCFAKQANSIATGTGLTLDESDASTLDYLCHADDWPEDHQSEPDSEEEEREETDDLQPDPSPMASAPNSEQSLRRAIDLYTENGWVQDARMLDVTGSPESEAERNGAGIVRVVIDAGHGGADRGTQTSELSEAEVVLDIALRLEQLLRKDSQIDVVLTRRADVFIPLDERIDIANREHGDLLISIHTNASQDPSTRGTETYYKRSQLMAQQRLDQMNTSGVGRRSQSACIETIAANENQDGSRNLAGTLQASLVNRLAIAGGDLGVKQASFTVLVGAQMPSVLTEIAFLSNEEDAEFLNHAGQRQNIAEALRDGVLAYLAARGPYPSPLATAVKERAVC